MTSHAESTTTYTAVFIALLVLLVATVAAAAVDLGPWNPVVAMAIAAAKAVLIILYFMHVRRASPLTRVFVVGGFLWLAILLGLTLSDYLTRHLAMSSDGPRRLWAASAFPPSIPSPCRSTPKPEEHLTPHSGAHRHRQLPRGGNDIQSLVEHGRAFRFGRMFGDGRESSR